MKQHVHHADTNHVTFSFFLLGIEKHQQHIETGVPSAAPVLPRAWALRHGQESAVCRCICRIRGLTRHQPLSMGPSGP